MTENHGAVGVIMGHHASSAWATATPVIFPGACQLNYCRSSVCSKIYTGSVSSCYSQSLLNLFCYVHHTTLHLYSADLPVAVVGHTFNTQLMQVSNRSSEALGIRQWMTG